MIIPLASDEKRIFRPGIAGIAPLLSMSFCCPSGVVTVHCFPERFLIPHSFGFLGFLITSALTVLRSSDREI